MRAIMVMFDSLNRRFLPAYGNDNVVAPNFRRLAGHSTTFDNCYGGSMPCMPARRELHTGRYNFLHRSWGPLEPFDDSVPEILSEAGVYTHLVTDHHHYWQDGGSTYHGRYNTFELIRGQEGDAWRGLVAEPNHPDSRNQRDRASRQDWVNRQHLQNESDHPQTRTFDAGLEFIRTNAGEDNWFLQIECFDPHEPYFTPEHYKQPYETGYNCQHWDWPPYKRLTEPAHEANHLRNEYRALLSMCDRSLGRVLDRFDELDMWHDTMLIVCTDHGFLLGEHDWWGKSVQPWYDETIHNPLFIWDPRSARSANRSASLVQTIDFGPTLLDFFELSPTDDMQGVALGSTISDDTPVRQAALFGIFGGHVNVTDGRYVYMRCCQTDANEPLSDYTLMPTHMQSRFSVEELRAARLAPPFSFTKRLQTLQTSGSTFSNPAEFGSLLFDLQDDPGQNKPLTDDTLELRMINLMVELMRANDAPVEQYERLGLPSVGPATRDHLVLDKDGARR